MKIIFFGTPVFAATILKTLLEHGVEIIAVVTKPDKPQGRSLVTKAPPVKELALSHNIPVYQPLKASHPDFAAFLKTLGADLFVVVAYSEILKENLLSIPPKGCINVHASLLPKYRGAAPIQRCIMAGDKESGVTIMAMRLELDAGAMYAVEKTEITPDMTAGELMPVLADLGSKGLLKVLKGMEEGSLNPLLQDPEQVTLAPKIKAEEGKIDWKEPAEVLYNKFRGLTPKPGVYCDVEIRGGRKRLLIKKMLLESALSGLPGSLLSVPGLVVAAGNGAVRLLKVQLEGKKALEDTEFLRGYSKEDLRFP